METTPYLVEAILNGLFFKNQRLHQLLPLVGLGVF
jgi:hypothetical protein